MTATGSNRPASMSAAGARQRRKLARPQELLDAALDLFVEVSSDNGTRRGKQ